MDGYSVEEAAEVLGIPQGRVWELIARGVLAGATEGGTTMRVFLKSAVAPAPGAGSPTGAANGERERTNGESHTELSPFRELLTEFRNLTERYGQALLALGEARGEVAALRGRVDLLEARMEMRLPVRPSSTVAWEMPGYPPAPAAPAPPTADHADTEAAQPSPSPSEGHGSPAPETEAVTQVPASPGDPAASAVPEAPDGDERQPAEDSTTSHADAGKRRMTGGRAAVAGLAEALARAEDPALLDLPGAREAAEAFAALRRQADEASPEPQLSEPQLEEEPPADAASPEADALAAYAPTIEQVEEEEPMAAPEPAAREAPPEAVEPRAPDEPMPAVAEQATEDEPAASAYPPDSPYSTEVVEPDWFADGDFAWLEATHEAAGDDAAAEPESGEPEPDPQLEPAPEAEHLDAEQERPAATAIQDAFEEADQTQSAPAAEPAPEPESGEAEPDPQPEPAPEAEHLDAEQERPAATAIQDAFEEPEAAASAWPPSDRPAGVQIQGFGLFRGQPEPARPEPPRTEPPRTEPPRATRDEEALMWLGDEFEAAGLEIAAPGWHSDEGAPEQGAPALQLSEAEIEQLAATEGWDRAEIDAIRDLVGRQAEEPPDAGPATPAGEQSTREHRPSPAERIPWITTDTGEPVDPDWLRGRRGPAADAYRRLRRLFQG